MNKRLIKPAVGAVMYAAFAVYLYYPYFGVFKRLDYLLLVNVWLGAIGCFILSRRWVSCFFSSLFAGAVYGFGPFMLSLAKFHPTAGLIAAVVPWLFLPAAFGTRVKWRWLSGPLSAIPFLAIAAFFQIGAMVRLFAIPIQAKCDIIDLAGLMAPLVMTGTSQAVISFYHIPLAAFVIGLAMMLAARRYGVIAIFCVGAVLAFCNPVFSVSPVIWLAIPILCGAVAVGIGLQGLLAAGWHDRWQVLVITLIMAALAAMTGIMSVKYANTAPVSGLEAAGLFAQSARMFLLGAIAVSIFYFLVRAKLRVHWVRLFILCLAVAVDIFLGATFIVDKIF